MLNVSINYSGAQKTEYSGRIATTMAADALGPSHQGISRHSINYAGYTGAWKLYKIHCYVS